jgi:hypothetical protein
VRSETAPADLGGFPGRALLYRDSHAFYALRRYLHAGEERPEQAMVSEGLAADLLITTSTSAQKPTEASALLVENAGARSAQVSAIAEAEKAREGAREQVVAELGRAQAAEASVEPATGVNDARYRVRLAADMAAAHPGDIVYEPGAESARPVTATARLIRDAIRERDRALALLEAARQKEEEALKAPREQRWKAESRLRQLDAAKYDQAQPASVLEPRLREIRDLAAKHGAEVLVVALPIDVQVSSDEWQKYGAPVTDMSSTLALTADMLASARSLGMRTLDAVPALRAASPGAFLHADIHMTKKGHEAVAEALATAIEEPAPTPTPKPGLPPGRSYPFFKMEDWYQGNELAIERAEEARCTVTAQDEWLGLYCTVFEESAHPHLDARVLSGGHGELAMRRSTALLQLRVPVLAGEKLRLRVEWETEARELEVEHAADGSWRGSFGPGIPGKPTGSKLLQTPGTCECAYNDTCEELVPHHAGCELREGEGYGADPCDWLYWCTFGERARWRPCPAGYVHADPAGRCLPLCDAKGACASGGRCETWQGVDVCKPH